MLILRLWFPCLAVLLPQYGLLPPSPPQSQPLASPLLSLPLSHPAPSPLARGARQLPPNFRTKPLPPPAQTSPSLLLPFPPSPPLLLFDPPESRIVGKLGHTIIVWDFIVLTPSFFPVIKSICCPSYTRPFLLVPYTTASGTCRVLMFSLSTLSTLLVDFFLPR